MWLSIKKEKKIYISLFAFIHFLVILFCQIVRVFIGYFVLLFQIKKVTFIQNFNKVGSPCLIQFSFTYTKFKTKICQVMYVGLYICMYVCPLSVTCYWRGRDGDF